MFIPFIVLLILFFIMPDVVITLGLIYAAIVFWPVTVCILGLWLLVAIFGD